MAEEKLQINFEASLDDRDVIDALAKIDGYDKRAPWLRAQIRRVISARRDEIVAISTLPHPVDGQPVPVIHVRRQA